MTDTSSPYHPDNMRAARDAAVAKRDAILAVSMPLREQRDALVRANQPGREPLDAQIAAAEVGLGDLQNEIAFLNVALGGRAIVVGAGSF